MSRTLKVYSGEDQTPVTDITDLIEWPEAEFAQRANFGEGTLSRIRLRDEDGRVGHSINLPAGLSGIALNPHNVVVWQESGVTMGRMRVSPKDWTRGEQVANRAREADIQLDDYNVDLHKIVVHGYVRPSETDKARVQHLVATYLSGSPRRTTNLNGSNYVSGSNLVTLPATTYNRTTTNEVLASIAAAANKQYFVTVDGELFYDGNDSTAYSCPFKISDRPEDHSSTVFGPQPSGYGPASSEDGQQMLSGLWLFYGDTQYVHVTNATAANTNSWWEDVVYDDTVTTATAATTLANAILAQRVQEERQYAVKIGPLTYGQAIQIKAGQIIQIKWRAIPDADDAYVSRRISELRWTTPEPFSFFADMLLDRPTKLHGQGQKIDAVAPKPAPAPIPDVIVAPTTDYSFLYTTDHKDEQTHTLSGGLERTISGGTGSWPPADGYLGGFYGRNNAGAFLSEKLPVSANTQYSFTEKFIFRYTPSNRSVYVRWLDTGGSTLREDLWIDGADYAIGVGYTKVGTFTSPTGTTDLRIRYSNFAGFFADDVYVQHGGSLVAGDSDPYAIEEGGSSPYYARSDDPRFTASDQHETTRLSRTMTNASGGALLSGAVVIATGEDTFTTTTTASLTTARVGFLLEDIANGATGQVAWESEGADAPTITAATSDGYFLYTSTTAGKVSASATRTTGAVGRVVKVDASGNPLFVEWWGVPDGSAGGTAGSAFVGVKVAHTSSQSINNNSSTKAIFGSGTEQWDTDAFHDTTTNNTRLTIPSGLGGKYRITGSGQWASDADGQRRLILAKNGANFDPVVATSHMSVTDGTGTFQTLSHEADLAVGDYIEMEVLQVSGAALNLNASLSLQKIDVGTLGAWTDYTPTLTAVTTNPTLGSSTLTGRYKQLDSKTYIVAVELGVVTGGAWNAGSGEWKFSLPAGLTAGSGENMVGSCYVLDSGTARFAGVALVVQGTTVIHPSIIADSAGDRTLKHNNPVTWATGDTVNIQVLVEVA